MRRISVLAAAVVLVTLGGGVALAQNGHDLFQQALVKERAEGDLEAAIELYQRIVTEHAEDRALVAKALAQLAECYEKLGEPGAQEIYQRVLRDYADQRDVARQAQDRLDAFATANVEQDDAETLHTEVTWANGPCGVPQGGVSPDGRLVTYVGWCDGGNLGIRNLATGESRRLTHTADNGGGENGGNYAGFSRISPDGEQVLYTWLRSSPVGETGELRLLPVHGDRTSAAHCVESRRRELCQPAGLGFPAATAWSRWSPTPPAARIPSSPCQRSMAKRSKSAPSTGPKILRRGCHPTVDTSRTAGRWRATFQRKTSFS